MFDAVQDTKSPSLDTYKHNSTPKKRGRQFHRVQSGVQKALDSGKTIRFLTLTSSPGSERDVNQDFQILKMRIRRKYKAGFEYAKIRTNEGNDVLHIVFWGSYIPQSWLSSQWSEIHQAKVVDIRMLKKFAGYRLSDYLSKQAVSGYLANQDGCTYSRMSWSFHWVYVGFCRTWRTLLRLFEVGHTADKRRYETALQLWKNHLSGDVIFEFKNRGWKLTSDGKLYFSNFTGDYLEYMTEKNPVGCRYVS